MKSVMACAFSATTYVAIIVTCFPSISRSDQLPAVSPSELLVACGQVTGALSITGNVKADGTPESAALPVVKGQLKDPVLAEDKPQPARFEAALRELIKMMYESSDMSQSHLKEIDRKACVAYAPDQYTEQDLPIIAGCAYSTIIYAMVADSRDKGLSSDLLLSKMKQEAYSGGGSLESKENQYAVDEDVIQYVYAHPNMTGKVLARQKLNDCFHDWKALPNKLKP